MKKIKQNIYSKILSFSIALSGIFSFSANAEPFPPGEHRVYSVAVIGGKFEDNNPVPVEYREGLNQEVIDAHCRQGIKITNFDETEKRGDESIWLGDIEISKDTILTGTKPGDQIFSFLDFSKKLYDLKCCQFAICPFETNPSESIEDLKDRMTRLTVYIRDQNEMCDIAFMPIIDDSQHDKNTVFKFGQELETFAREKLSAQYNVRYCIQNLNTYQIRKSNPDKYYAHHLSEGMLRWSFLRKIEYKSCMEKDVPCFDPVKFKWEKTKGKKINIAIKVTIPVAIIAIAALSSVLLKKSHIYEL